MGAGFVILVWFLIACILGAIWISALVLFVFSRRRGWKIAKGLSAMIAVSLPLLGILSISAIAVKIVRLSIPKYVFQATLQKSPVEAVHNLQSKVWSFADEKSVYLRFNIDHGTFEQLIPKGLPHVSMGQFERMRWHGNFDPPPWWKPSYAASDEIYFNSSHSENGQGYANEMTVFTYNAARHAAYYQFEGID